MGDLIDYPTVNLNVYGQQRLQYHCVAREFSALSGRSASWWPCRVRASSMTLNNVPFVDQRNTCCM